MTSPSAGAAAAVLADLADIAPRRGGHACHTRFAMEQIPVEARTAVAEAMDNPLVSSADLARLLNKHTGSTVTGNQVARHRRRGQPNGCKCPRGGDA